MLHYIAALLTILGAHRIWNYEDVFGPLRSRLSRSRLGRSGLLTPLLCPVCNPVWIGVGVGALAWYAGALDVWLAATLPIAAYAIVRTAVWAYAQPWPAGRSAPATPAPPLSPGGRPLSTAPAAAAAPAAPAPPSTPAGATGEKCTPCEARAKELAADRLLSDKYKQRVVLLTALAGWDSSYSLVSVILDQARMLARDPHRLVSIWVMAGTDLSRAPQDLPPNVIIRPYVPATAWREDVIDDAAVQRLTNELQTRLLNLGNATIITHDLLLVSWYLTFAKVLHQIGTVRAFTWIHQIHSCTGPRPQGVVAQYRASLPTGHLLGVVSPTEVESAARYYEVPPERVVVLPNARDLQAFGSTPQAAELLRRTPHLSAQVAQTLPLSSPRMESKGIMRAVRAMAAIHRAGASTHLLVAEAHATGPAAEMRRRGVRAVAAQAGLPVEALSFSAELLPDTATYGLDAATVRQLLYASNVFIFPSISESAGLVALEAGLCGNLLVLNANVPALQHLLTATQSGIPWPFPAVRAPDAPEPDAASYDALARLVLARLGTSPWRPTQNAFGFDAVAPQLERALASAKPVS